MSFPVPVTGGAAAAAVAVPWWRALSEQRWFVFVFVLSAACTSLALTYAFGEKYESTAAISYRVQEVTRFKALQNEALGSPAPQAPFKVIGATLQEVLKSDSVLRDVVMSLKLYEKEVQEPSGPWYKVWYQTAKNWLREYGGYAWQLMKHGRIIEDEPVGSAISELRGNIKVTNRDSYIFNLAVRDKSPERAARIVEHLSSVLSTWLLEFDRQPGRTRAEQLRGLLDAKREELSARRKEIEQLLAGSKVTSVQQDGEKLTEHLFALQLEVSRLDSDIARARQRLAAVDAKLSVKRRVLEAMGEVPATPAASVENGERIAPEDFRKLASERVFDDLELSSAVAKRNSLQASIDSVAARMRITPGVQNRYETLKLAVESAEREFTMLSDAYQEAALRATSAVSEVRVLHPALVPTSPVSPIKVYHVLLALGLGLPLAIGLVYFLDFLGLTWLLAPARRPQNAKPASALPPAAAPAAPDQPPTLTDTAAEGGPANG